MHTSARAIASLRGRDERRVAVEGEMEHEAVGRDRRRPPGRLRAGLGGRAEADVELGAVRSARVVLELDRERVVVLYARQVDDFHAPTAACARFTPSSGASPGHTIDRSTQDSNPHALPARLIGLLLW